LKQITKNIKKVITKVQTNPYGCEKTTVNLASKLSLKGIEISALIILRIFKKVGFKKTKLTRKPRLIKKIKEDRL